MWRPRSGASGSVRPSPAAALLVVAFAVGYVGQGGYYPAVQRMLVVLLTGAAMAAWGRHRSSRSCLPVRRMWWAAAAVAVWAVVSASVNGVPASAIGTVGLVAGLIVVCSVVRSLTVDERELFVVALLSLGCVVALTGWFGVLSHINLELWVADIGVRRASTSITYPSAAAGLLGMLALIAIARAAHRTTVGAHAAVCVLLVGLTATCSRVGMLAFAIGIVVLLALLGPRDLLLAAMPGALGAGVALAGAAPSFVFAAPTSVTHAVLVLGAGLGLTAVLCRRSPTFISFASAVGLGLAAWAVWRGALGVLVDTERWSVVSPLRGSAQPAAIDVGLHHPLFGAGPGHAILRWRDPGGAMDGTRYAHNEYAQAFAETGAVGLALIVGLIAVAFLALRDTRSASPLGPHASLRAGAMAALVAFGVHSAGDFPWRIPVLPLTLAALVGLALPTISNTSRNNSESKGGKRWMTSSPILTTSRMAGPR